MPWERRCSFACRLLCDRLPWPGREWVQAAARRAWQVGSSPAQGFGQRAQQGSSSSPALFLPAPLTHKIGFLLGLFFWALSRCHLGFHHHNPTSSSSQNPSAKFTQMNQYKNEHSPSYWHPTVSTGLTIHLQVFGNKIREKDPKQLIFPVDLAALDFITA